MTREELIETIEANETEFLKFERIEKKLSQRPDVHAFRVLDMLVPGTNDMIGSSHHDEFFLSIDIDELLAVAQESHIIDLIRCGVGYDRSCDSLYMFT